VLRTTFYYLLPGFTTYRRFPPYFPTFCFFLAPRNIQLNLRALSMEASSVQVRPRVSTLKMCMGWYPGAYYNFPIHPPTPPNPQESQFVRNGGGPDFLFPLTSSSFAALFVTPDPLKNVTLVENRALMTGVVLALFILILLVVSYRRSPWRKLPSGPRRLPIIGNTLQLLDKSWLRSEDCKERFSGSSLNQLFVQRDAKMQVMIVLKRK
jgi:hypothetical protein